jgi:hypothetical protein
LARNSAAVGTLGESDNAYHRYDSGNLTSAGAEKCRMQWDFSAKFRQSRQAAKPT